MISSRKQKHADHTSGNGVGNGGGSGHVPPKVPPKQKHRKKASPCSSLTVVLACFLSSVLSFYTGIYIGWKMERPGLATPDASCGCQEPSRAKPGENHHRAPNHIEWAPVVGAARKELRPGATATGETGEVRDPLLRSAKSKRELAQSIAHNLASAAKNGGGSTESGPGDLAPKTVEESRRVSARRQAYLERFEADKNTHVFSPRTEFVDRDEFVARFDSLGVPFDTSEQKSNDRVAIVYGDTSALPEREAVVEGSKKLGGFGREPNEKRGVLLSVDDATKNCNNLHVVLTNFDRRKECVALVGQYESFHLHKLMRASEKPASPKNKSKFLIDPSQPLRPVNRNMRDDGGRSIAIPSKDDLKRNWRNLVPYLQSLEETLEKLRPVAESVASHNGRNTVIVMVCNFGQSELLMNFVCNARARGLGKELSNILLFSTDKETHELATKVLGLTSFYDEKVFGGMPSKAAEEYGDDIFRKLMFAKVYCVHMVSMLGHDLLFQDVDVVWYKDPLSWFHDDTKGGSGYDLVFQDDGSRTLVYAPYAANTGFYYARNNEATQAFFNALLMSGDLIMATFSHQVALVALLSEHVSLYGLRVKVWNRRSEEFPGGYWYHEAHDKMRAFVAGELQPYVFHMCWTENKEDKVRYMQQMGQWYLEESCRNTPAGELLGKSGGSVGGGKPPPLSCCRAEPLVRCHYRDKPSILPCPDSPPIDEDGGSFW
ncbi:unnamed protein product [Pseudo-nitzschia multistriata]|uniref:Nucleotide-diphospho-sugar transferase domain-containing protein n=1 Tax=Pseudo-nitzschia multistriata TaxID=183589 RepID=A0A448YWA8_9STRA|nr:unnamed protein product [Pseudo-nitzschia multistriata]